MNTPKPNLFRTATPILLSLVLFFTSFAGAPYRPDPNNGTGSLCNYSSWSLAVLMQKSGHARLTTWKMLPAGQCQTERVIGVLGRTTLNNNAQPQMVTINGGHAIALNSLKANPAPALGLVTIVSPNRSARLISAREAYSLNRKLISENPNLAKLEYSLGLETVKLNRPLSGAGYGSPRSIGTPAHAGADAYAIDFPVAVGRDRRSPEVSAALAGQVVYSDCTTDYGCAVVVRSANIKQWGVVYYAVYAQLASEGRAALGANLEKGQLLGRVNRTTRLDKDHLHFSVRVSSVAYDGTAALYGNGAVYAINARMFMR